MNLSFNLSFLDLSLKLVAIEPVSELDMSSSDPVCQAGLAAVEPIEANALISQLGLLTIEPVF